MKSIFLGLIFGQFMFSAVGAFADSSSLELLQPGNSSDVMTPPIAEAKVLMASDIGLVTGHVVRIAYIIPTNRTAQAHAVASLQNAIIQHQNWYRDQMLRNGFGPKTFRFETQADGITPKINIVNVAETDSYLRGDIWGRTIAAASAAGVPVWTSKQVWWLIPEAHLEAANGSITGGTALGASFGSGDDPGVAMMGSDALARYQTTFFTNDTAYHNQIVSQIGPFPLQQNVSFPWFEGTTFSSIASSVLGAAGHELTHAFGQPHDFRNDNNFNGNLMGNGVRGFRGNLFEDRYPGDFTRVAYGSALALNVSRYFNTNAFTDNVLPALTISTTGTNTPVNGMLQINFSAADDGNLSAAWLMLNGDLVEEMHLVGSSTLANFITAYYNPGQTNRFTISVFDAQGNKRSLDTFIIPRTGFNRAPQPFITLSKHTAFVGENVSFSASQSSDPDHSLSSVQVEWDLNGDGTYEFPPSTSKTLNQSFTTPGDRLVRARLTDPAGAKSLSAPVALRILPVPLLSISSSSDHVLVSWTTNSSGFVLETKTNISSGTWHSVVQTITVQGNTKVVAATNSFNGSFFRLRK